MNKLSKMDYFKIALMLAWLPIGWMLFMIAFAILCVFYGLIIGGVVVAIFAPINVFYHWLLT